jgi:hypothetical protein
MKRFFLQLLLCGTCYGAATQDLVWVTNATRVQGTGPLFLLNSSNQINATTGRFFKVELNGTNIVDLIPAPGALSYLTNIYSLAGVFTNMNVSTGAFLSATVAASAANGTEVVNFQTLTNLLSGAYISVSLTNTITSSGVRSTNVLMYTGVDIAHRMSLVGSNQLQVSQTGVYRIFPSIIASASSPNSHCRVWIQQNGTNVPRSAMRILLSAASQEMMLAEEVFLSCYSNDLISVCWGSLDNAGMQLVTTGETMGPISPAAIVVMQYMAAP